MSELADGVLISRSGLTRLVDRIERDGLLRRERCEEDARGWFAAITVEGREVFQRARQTHLDGSRSCSSRASPATSCDPGTLWEKLEEGQAPRQAGRPVPPARLARQIGAGEHQRRAEQGRHVDGLVVQQRAEEDPTTGTMQIATAARVEPTRPIRVVNQKNARAVPASPCRDR